MRNLKTISTSLLVITLGCAACSNEEPTEPQAPQVPSATGIWQGDVVTTFGGARSLTLTLQEANDSVSGSYAIASPDNEPYWIGTVNGERSGTNLSLTLPGNSVIGDSPGIVHFLGTMRDADTIDGLLNGSGWVDTPVLLKRQ